MASESPDVDQMSNQEETQPNDPSDNNFQDEEIDPNAPTQYIEDDKSNENQVSSRDIYFSFKFSLNVLFLPVFQINSIPNFKLILNLFKGINGC